MSSKEDDIRAFELFELWKKGLSLKQLAEAVGEPAGDVRRRLKAVQVKLVKEKGAEKHETKIHI
jgi:hypothetical protein